ncbi:DUF4430 domain-containing protein [Paenibacillus sp. PAMC21692]|uniref:DUF4430 domain-containing protein n=1 Tax=Paenibacillus sp. PAMC21692 TaxID=2762320 RepID=UPI00164D03F9|nr:DUF4430 domain-containing protein [Paenibacillus sp. PAMC21692]QNK60208.1 DUF4430 domain-containing protein [Paenibacillus sp. PAMC21692]
MKTRFYLTLAAVMVLLITASFFMGSKDNVVPLPAEEYAAGQTAQADNEQPETEAPREEQGTDNETSVETDVEVPNAESPDAAAPDAEASEDEQPTPAAVASQPPTAAGKPAAPEQKPDEERIEQPAQEDNEEKIEEKQHIIAEDNKKTDKDRYLTDPVPEGKPEPVEWQDAVVEDEVEYKATLSVTAKTILNNLHLFDQDKLEMLPEDGVIYAPRTVTFNKGESVFDVLLREMRGEGIHMEFEMTPIYNSNYIEGINNIYEFDCGELSGWMYKVNGWFPNYGASRYQLKDHDEIEWVYTCDLGRDIGGAVATGGR